MFTQFPRFGREWNHKGITASYFEGVLDPSKTGAVSSLHDDGLNSCGPQLLFARAFLFLILVAQRLALFQVLDFELPVLLQQGEVILALPLLPGLELGDFAAAVLRLLGRQRRV